MKIALIMAAGKKMRDAVARGKPFRSYAPTTLIQLAGLVPPELGAEISVYDQNVEVVPEIIDADLVGISAITCAAPEAYRIADRCRERGSKVVLGGYHATLLPDEALGHADAVVTGYAETAWPRLLRDFAGGGMRRRYDGTEAPAPEDFVPPRRDLLKSRLYLLPGTVEASRGCPNDCGYCVVGAFSGRSPSFRPIKQIAADLEKTGKTVLFLDANLFAFPDYARALLRELTPLKKRWFTGASTKFPRDFELMRAASRSGLRGVLIGFESVCQESLDETNKGFNRALEYRDLVGRLHDNGIGVLGSFIFGFDGDDASIFARTAEFVDAARIDLVKYGIVTPSPGSALHRRLASEGRLLTRDWEAYGTELCVFRPARMTKDQLEVGCRQAYRATYASASILHRTAKTGRDWLFALGINVGFGKFGRA